MTTKLDITSVSESEFRKMAIQTETCTTLTCHNCGLCRPNYFGLSTCPDCLSEDVDVVSSIDGQICDFCGRSMSQETVFQHWIKPANNHVLCEWCYTRLEKRFGANLPF